MIHGILKHTEPLKFTALRFLPFREREYPPGIDGYGTTGIVLPAFAGWGRLSGIFMKRDGAVYCDRESISAMETVKTLFCKYRRCPANRDAS